MATSASMRAFTWGDGVQVAGQDLRLGQLSALLSALGGPAGNALGVGSGVRDAAGSPLKVNASSGLSVTVNVGFAAVQGTAAANSGAYMGTLDAQATLTCGTADLVNPRIDSVIVQFVDVGTSSSTGTVNIQPGTPSPSPSPPALPANSLLLCNITVPANATSLTSANLSDQRQFLAAAGGIKNYQNASLYPTVGAVSHYAHDSSLGRLRWFNGTTLQAPKTTAFGPVTASSALLATANSTTPVNVVSTSVTTDGNTQVRVTVNVASLGIPSPTAVGNGFNLIIVRDTTQLESWTVVCTQTGNRVLDGRTLTVFDTPSNNAHTYALQIVTQGAGTITAPIGSAITVEAISS